LRTAGFSPPPSPGLLGSKPSRQTPLPPTHFGDVSGAIRSPRVDSSTRGCWPMRDWGYKFFRMRLRIGISGSSRSRREVRWSKRPPPCRTGSRSSRRHPAKRSCRSPASRRCGSSAPMLGSYRQPSERGADRRSPGAPRQWRFTESAFAPAGMPQRATAG